MRARLVNRNICAVRTDRPSDVATYNLLFCAGRWQHGDKVTHGHARAPLEHSTMFTCRHGDPGSYSEPSWRRRGGGVEAWVETHSLTCYCGPSSSRSLPDALRSRSAAHVVTLSSKNCRSCRDALIKQLPHLTWHLPRNSSRTWSDSLHVTAAAPDITPSS